MSSAINIVPSTSFFDLQYTQVYSVYTSFAVLNIFLFSALHRNIKALYRNTENELFQSRNIE